MPLEKSVKVWQLVKDIEEKSGGASTRLGELKATFIVNYGKRGRCIKDVINEGDTALSMFVSVVEYYQKTIEVLKKQVEKF